MPLTTPATSASAVSSDSLLDVAEASEIRNSRGERRFGSTDTIRRRIKDGSLPYERVGIKYFVRLSALEALARVKISTDRSATVITELEIAADHAFAFSGPLSDEQCDSLVARLKGVA